MITRESRLRIQEYAAGDSLLAFCPLISQGYPIAPHLELLTRKLEQFEHDIIEHKSPRLLISMPPRHYKSQTCSVAFPSYLLGKHPNWRIILSSYGAELPLVFSRQIRRFIRDPSFWRIFSRHNVFPINISPESSSVEQWDLSPPYRGGLRSVSINSGVTGFGADVIIIDDPIKNRQEARSSTYKQRVRETYSSELRTRLEPGGGIIVVATRWAKDDLIGWLQAKSETADGEPFEVLNLPAIDSNGNALFADKYPVSELEKIKSALLPSDWRALYQGEPTPEGGGKVKLEWFNKRDTSPTLVNMVRGWDTALTKDSRKNQKSSGGPDFTVGVLGGTNNSELWIIHRVKERLEEPDVINLIEQTALDDLKLGCRTVAIETGSRKSVYQEIIRREKIRNAGIRVIPISPTESKEERAYGWMTAANGGLFYIKSCGWTDDYLDSLCMLGIDGEHDDDADATSNLYNAIYGNMTNGITNINMSMT